MKKLQELTIEELKKVWEINEKLQTEVSDDWQESQRFFVEEVLNNFRDCLKKWDIGFNNYNFIEIKDGYSFLESMQSAVDMFGIMDEEDIKRLNEAVTSYDNSFGESEDIEKLEIESEYFEEKLLKFLSDLTTFDFDYIESYFSDFYIESRMDDGDFFIDDEFILYENIIKCYK